MLYFRKTKNAHLLDYLSLKKPTPKRGRTRTIENQVLQYRSG